MTKTEEVHFRISKEEKSELDKIFAKNEYNNRSQMMNKAIEQFINRENGKEEKITLDTLNRFKRDLLNENNSLFNQLIEANNNSIEAQVQSQIMYKELNDEIKFYNSMICQTIGIPEYEYFDDEEE